MQLRRIFPIGLVGVAAGQSGSPNLLTALQPQNVQLSPLNGLIQNSTGLTQQFSQLTNVTLLAPSNDAIQKILAGPLAPELSQPGVFQLLVNYLTLNGTYYASNFTQNMPMFIPTHLTNPMFDLVDGGQRVEILASGGNITAFSALKQPSNFVTTNVNFTGGTIHIIDTVTVVPLNTSYTLGALNLTAAAGAIQFAGLITTADTMPDITIFVPNNAAFAAVASVFSNLSMAQVAQGLKDHAIPGFVGPSSTFTNGTLTTVAGGSVNITVIGSTVFVNDAKVIIPDILVRNGVIHVIDQVLNPGQTGSNPQINASTTTMAWTSASSGTAGIPFTSGVAVPGSIVPTNTGSPVATTIPMAPANPIKTGVVVAAALFGGAAIMMNL
ncbi:FAS1 domain-containing protein [Microdochium trichocladiopsis]|uniref:FAS1 domain-containing protein n=1 Tax=Microdochium trichocladiopsis TaxID=1682393 RepID=A0A9P9BUL3_9PEZI|nr:FAS1 domain-containing protein [Microdochium trichocladiopsis]KAH7031564.1 FAS1 domain-containing protein [Microdochium trichocladiopsis]